ncbi:hypothetical protein BV898_14209 [Hypsibius exemplaris]|uniref:Uncharacterized protein n=1 Tax=Hypsibius exemplaris TaxID=2072580 RepID=A0A1W0W8I6_HYPEX|nr:hypothetical protein BV898_14209 [Hypsibius exemplaris]
MIASLLFLSQASLTKAAITHCPSIITPLPSLRKLASLDFEAVRSVDANGATLDFPLQAFTALVNRTKITSLSLVDTQLSSLDKDLFFQFSGLKELRLSRCGLQRIDVNAFAPLMRDVSPGNPFDAGFAKLTVGGNDKLTVFPWDVLLPVSKTLETVSIESNSNLVSVAFSPNSPTTMSLPSVVSLTVTGNSALKLIPADVLDTLHYKKSAVAEALPVLFNLSVVFTNNGNACDDCQGLSSLSAWARAGTVNSEDRYLDFACSRDAAGNAPEQATGTTEFWRQYVEPRTCRAVETSTTAASGTSTLAVWNSAGFILLALIPGALVLHR